jgi:hypothetical protein
VFSNGLLFFLETPHARQHCNDYVRDVTIKYGLPLHCRQISKPLTTMASASISQKVPSTTNNQGDNNIVNNNNNNSNSSNNSSASGLTADLITHQQQQSEMIEDEDPLLISQSLTYVTDDGGTLHSFQSAPFSTGTSNLLN